MACINPLATTPSPLPVSFFYPSRICGTNKILCNDESFRQHVGIVFLIMRNVRTGLRIYTEQGDVQTILKVEYLVAAFKLFQLTIDGICQSCIVVEFRIILVSSGCHDISSRQVTHTADLPGRTHAITSIGTNFHSPIEFPRIRITQSFFRRIRIIQGTIFHIVDRILMVIIHHIFLSSSVQLVIAQRSGTDTHTKVLRAGRKIPTDFIIINRTVAIQIPVAGQTRLVGYISSSLGIVSIVRPDVSSHIRRIVSDASKVNVCGISPFTFCRTRTARIPYHVGTSVIQIVATCNVTVLVLAAPTGEYSILVVRLNAQRVGVVCRIPVVECQDGSL